MNSFLQNNLKCDNKTLFSYICYNMLKGCDKMYDLWGLFLGGTTRDSVKKEFDGKKVGILIFKYTLLALSIPAIYLLLSYLVQKGIW